ncbi:MAG: isoleucine--tRNA ligase [Bacteroidia bacterium]|nr:isoleucine--tRNA ligase [Bacteroidia bacterium]
MSTKNYKEYKQLDLPKIAEEVLAFWKQNEVFEKSISTREDGKPFVFYEGPPSANGMPGIHHVMARTIKDIFCRYKTLKGFQVKRKAGWDTHGLPVELQVEEKLNIKKEDIGKKISIADYNKECRSDVMQFKDVWEDLTEKMGFWLSMDDPYITFEKDYIETVWYLLKELYDKKLLYKGYSIQPFSPAAGTGLSSHELNYHGCYRDVTDSTVVAQFKIKGKENEYFLAWTTTPWTLASNTALAVGKKIDYVKVKTFNRYSKKEVIVILAKELLDNFFSSEDAELNFEEYDPNADGADNHIPYQVLSEHKGADFIGIEYEQLLPYAQPDDGDAFRVVHGDFVSTEDGTGMVHIAPSFGADDLKVAKQSGIGSLTLVDKSGKFKNEVTDFAGRYVKNYLEEEDYVSVDVDICVKLKKENKAFRLEKYTHSYPHCWRTDKPIIYYPLDSWFIKVTAHKDRMIELNKTINWKPEFTGARRFGNWLENLVDWNISRTRFWGTPLPIWISEDQSEIKCIGSIEELKEEVKKAVEAGFMDSELQEDFDPHRPYVDDVVLVSYNGQKMNREPELIDVWFDSGAMPYAQWHYPFKNKEEFKKNFPADYIAEGVDQTRGWFYTMHAIAVMLFDSVAFKNVIANGMVLDKDGNKMSKRLGNAIDPFEAINKYGIDTTRWYMISNAQPWDNLKFDIEGMVEVQRKFFGTLYNTYNFFALYANIDDFNYNEKEIQIEKRAEIDRWIISVLNSLIKEVEQMYEQYEPTKAARLIRLFVTDHLSNWYVRLSRRRFWKGSYSEDKISAYQTLYNCLESVAHIISPIAPFYSDQLYQDLNQISGKKQVISVHLSDFPKYDDSLINKELEAKMRIAQQVSSMILSLRKKSNIKVRQPLNKILIPVLNQDFQARVEAVKPIILAEVNVKEIDYISTDSDLLVKQIKPDFKALGPKYGKKMKEIASIINQFSSENIETIEAAGTYEILLKKETVNISLEEVEISYRDIPGWLVANEGKITVALDITVSDQLKDEGIARELVNRIQNIRKESDFEVTDKITVRLKKHDQLDRAVNNNLNYICTEILANSLELVDNVEEGKLIEFDNIKTLIRINKN